MGRLANSTRGLGRVSVRGLRRVPKPIYITFKLLNCLESISICRTSNKNKCLHYYKLFFKDEEKCREQERLKGNILQVFIVKIN